MVALLFLQVVDRLAGEEGMEGVREEVPGLLGQILGGELVMLEGLPDERIRCENRCCQRPSLRPCRPLTSFYRHIHTAVKYTAAVHLSICM